MLKLYCFTERCPFKKVMNEEFLFDGIVDCLYQLLWMKEKSQPSHSLFSFNLPHTIIIKNNQPVAWYFSDGAGRVLRKYESSIKMKNVLEVFEREVSNSKISSYYITFTDFQGKFK